MNINNFTFRSSIFFHLENKFEILLILGILKVAENSYPSSPHSKSGGFCPQTFPAKGPAIFEPRSNFLTMGPTAFCIAQTFRSWGQPFCSNFAKIPHVGWVWRIKVPTSSCAPPPPTPLRHDIDGCIKYTLGVLILSGRGCGGFVGGGLRCWAHIPTPFFTKILHPLVFPKVSFSC